ncbi:MAG: DUF255 domain-containing protein [Cytophagales bacterium]|nr:DUF255 domain-containing protein [Cytophagales bacterium]
MKKLFLLLYLIPLASIAQVGIQFQSLSWDEALAASKKSNKLIFIDAYTTWCGPCKALEKYTFTDASVGTLFNASFINVRFDMEQYPGLELAEKYEVNLYPTLLFVNGNGELIHRGCGAMEIEELLDLGSVALNGKQTLSALKGKYENGERSIEIIDQYVQALQSACQNVDEFLSDYFEKVPNDSLSSEANWYVFSEYDFDIYGDRFQFFLENQKGFEANVEQKKVQDKIYDTFMMTYFKLTESEDFALFGVQSVIYMAEQNEFDRKEELLNFLNFGYGELSGNWELYSDAAIAIIKPESENPDLVLDVAWKFYLFVDDPDKLFKALSWTKIILEIEEPNPSNIDTYASLLFKIGRKEDAIKFEEQAFQLAESWGEDTQHFEYQLAKFKK